MPIEWVDITSTSGKGSNMVQSLEAELLQHSTTEIMFISFKGETLIKITAK